MDLDKHRADLEAKTDEEIRHLLSIDAWGKTGRKKAIAESVLAARAQARQIASEERSEASNLEQIRIARSAKNAAWAAATAAIIAAICAVIAVLSS